MTNNPWKDVSLRMPAGGRPMVVALVISFLLFPTRGHGEIEITLKNDFIEQMKDRATVSATYTVDKAHVHPNPPPKDGDMHIAGRAPEVGLPIVAEIMNAGFEKQSVDLIHGVEGTGNTVNMVGAWRIWTEHGGNSTQVQGAPLSAFTTTNPPHVFEIHPIVSLNNTSLAKSFRPIVPLKPKDPGFKPKDAHDAFRAYENIRSHISATQSTTTIVTSMGGYNYVEFVLELNETPVKLEDGHAAEAQVLTVDGQLLVHNRRMVFVQDTPPDKAVRSLGVGKQLHVLGVPRIDLKLVSWRTRNAQERPEVLAWNLPYEIVVVGVYSKK